MSGGVKGGITRRDALRRGTMAGLGMVWVAPKVASFSMTAQYAQATSPVSETTVPEGETTVPENEGTQVETTEASKPTTATSEPEVLDTVLENTSTTQGSVAGSQVEAVPEVEDEVLAAQLPFTGLPFEQLIPLAGGAIATGAVAVRLAREKKESESSE